MLNMVAHCALWQLVVVLIRPQYIHHVTAPAAALQLSLPQPAFDLLSFLVSRLRALCMPSSSASTSAALPIPSLRGGYSRPPGRLQCLNIMGAKVATTVLFRLRGVSQWISSQSTSLRAPSGLKHEVNPERGEKVDFSRKEVPIKCTFPEVLASTRTLRRMRTSPTRLRAPNGMKHMVNLVSAEKDIFIANCFSGGLRLRPASQSQSNYLRVFDYMEEMRLTVFSITSPEVPPSSNRMRASQSSASSRAGGEDSVTCFPHSSCLRALGCQETEEKKLISKSIFFLKGVQG